MQSKQTLILVLVAAMIFGLTPILPVSADFSIDSKQQSETITGMVQVFADDTDPSVESFKFVIRPLDIEKTMEAKKIGIPSGKKDKFGEDIYEPLIDGQFVYQDQFINLDYRPELRDLTGKLVRLSGSGYNRITFGFDTPGTKTTEAKSFYYDYNQNFRAEKAEVLWQQPIVNNLKVEESSSDSLNTAPMIVPAVPTVGPHKTLIMYVGFAGNSTPLYSRQQLKDHFFTGEFSTNEYFKEASFRKFHLAGIVDPLGDVTPYMETTVQAPADPTPANCGTVVAGALRMAAEQSASDLGYGGVYQTKVLFFDPGPCGSMAQASVGTFGAKNEINLIYLSAPSAGTQAALDNKQNASRHEFIHNFGQGGHSGCREFDGSSGGTQNDLASTLGNQYKEVLPDIVLRLKLGWLTTHKLANAITTSGVHRIRIQTPAIATKGRGPSSPPAGVFVILRDLAGNLTGKVLIIERRRNTGKWEQFGLLINYSSGVILREISVDLSDKFTGSTLLVGQSGSACSNTAPLTPGITWSNNSYGVSVSASHGVPTGQWLTITTGGNYGSSLVESEEVVNLEAPFRPILNGLKQEVN